GDVLLDDDENATIGGPRMIRPKPLGERVVALVLRRSGPPPRDRGRGVPGVSRSPGARGLLLALAALAVAPAPSPAQDLLRPPSVVVEGVPEIPASLVRTLRNTYSFWGASFGDWVTGRRKLLILTRSGETSQVFFVPFPGGAWQQLTI